MKYGWLKAMVGETALPEDVLERCQMFEFADSHHVLGQVAAVWHTREGGKTRDVLENGLLRTTYDRRMLNFEMDRIERAFTGTELEPILLKGASYVAQGLEAGKGRRVSDIDILLPENQLEQAEKLLLIAGWQFDEATDNEYDQSYYREHMHELPPLRHKLRRTILDVHHRLLPRTSRIMLNSGAFIQSARQIEGRRLKVLTSVDTFLHSAVHCFGDGSFDTPVRSLIELKYLLADLSDEEGSELVTRAKAVGAATPLAYALWGLSCFFDDAKATALAAKNTVKPNRLVCWAIQQKLENIQSAYAAKFLLYLRSHYLRMSLPKLFWHLLTKSFRRLKKQPELPLPPGFE